MSIFLIRTRNTRTAQSPNGMKIHQIHGRQNAMKLRGFRFLEFSREQRLTSRILEHREQEVKRTRSKKNDLSDAEMKRLVQSYSSKRVDKLKIFQRAPKWVPFVDQRLRNEIWKKSRCICVFRNSTRPDERKKKYIYIYIYMYILLRNEIEKYRSTLLK